MAEMHGFTLVEWGDHQFAAWLRKQDPNWTYHKTGEESTNFTNSRGEVLAVVFYNNRECTHRIYAKTERLHK